MIKSIITNFLLYLVLFVAGYIAWCFYESVFTTAAVIKGVHVDKAVYQAGDPIVLTTMGYRNKLCSVEGIRFLQNEDKTFAYVLIVESNRPFVGEEKIMVTVAHRYVIPPLSPGSYRIVTRMRYYCNVVDVAVPNYNEYATESFEIR